MKNDGNNQWLEIQNLYPVSFRKIRVNRIKANCQILEIGKKSHISYRMTASRSWISHCQNTQRGCLQNPFCEVFFKITFTSSYNSFPSAFCLFLYNHKGKRGKTNLTLPQKKLFPTHTDQLNNLLSSDQPIQDSPLLSIKEGAFYWGQNPLNKRIYTF